MKRRLLIPAACCLLASCARQSTGADVQLALQPPSTNNYPSYLAQWLGFYGQEGLRVTILADRRRIKGAPKRWLGRARTWAAASMSRPFRWPPRGARS